MAATDCTIRERRDDDLPALAAALVRVHAQDGYPVEGVADPVGWLDHAQALQSWTAVVNDVPIGQVTLTEADPNDEHASDAARAVNYLCYVYGSDPDAWGQLVDDEPLT